MTAALASNFLVNILLSGSLSLLWGMINSMQVISYFPLLNLIMPANCQYLFSIIITVATFDLFPMDGILEIIDDILGAIDDEYLMLDNFKEFEYESTNPINNLKIVFIFLVALIFMRPFYKLIELAFKCSERVTSSLEKFKNTQLYWNVYLRFILETFLELSITSLLRIKVFRMENKTEVFLTLIAIFILLTLVICMFGSISFLRHNFEKIREKSFTDKYGALTLGLYHRSK